MQAMVRAVALLVLRDLPRNGTLSGKVGRIVRRHVPMTTIRNGIQSRERCWRICRRNEYILLLFSVPNTKMEKIPNAAEVRLTLQTSAGLSLEIDAVFAGVVCAGAGGG